MVSRFSSSDRPSPIARLIRIADDGKNPATEINADPIVSPFNPRAATYARDAALCKSSSASRSSVSDLGTTISLLWRTFPDTEATVGPSTAVLFWLQRSFRFIIEYKVLLEAIAHSGGAAGFVSPVLITRRMSESSCKILMSLMWASSPRQ